MRRVTNGRSSSIRSPPTTSSAPRRSSSAPDLPMPGEWLTKSEVNHLYYDTVAGDIVFQTEASVGHHPAGVARLISARARSLGKRHVRVLEIGANDAEFARAVLLELRTLREARETSLERIDYVAVELARGSLERAAAREE